MEPTTPVNSKVKMLCPTCKSGELTFTPGKAVCSKCNASFSVTNNIIDLIPKNPRQEHIWGGALESETFVRFYESRWWRRGLVNWLYLAISFDDELEMISQASNLKDAQAVLDLACGSGIYTRPFAQWLSTGTAVGLDLSMPMLEYASTKAQSERIDNIVFIHGDAHDLPFPEDQFDVVNCSGALHAFPDLPKALSEVHRVLKPGGTFAGGIGRWPWSGTLGQKFRNWYKKRAGIKGFFREELEALFEEAGFTGVTCHYERRAWFIMSAVKPK